MELIALSLQINGLLQEYIKIHDDIFAFSIRKIIPFPIIFKPIDYKSHYENLCSIKAELQKVKNSTDAFSNNNIEFAKAIKQYCEALLATINILCKMCNNLYEKSTGNLTSYSKSQYNADFDNYQSSIEKYRISGNELNFHFQKTQ